METTGCPIPAIWAAKTRGIKVWVCCRRAFSLLLEGLCVCDPIAAVSFVEVRVVYPLALAVLRFLLCSLILSPVFCVPLCASLCSHYFLLSTAVLICFLVA